MASDDRRKDRTKDRPKDRRREPPAAQVRLDQPRASRQTRNLRPRNGDRFGQLSEDIARFFGTARYLGIQTALVIVWIFLNILVWTRSVRWDPYPFILLNLAFSTQAAYAAPLILLAQNRQANRDKVQVEQDRRREERSIDTAEYLVREVASLRMAMNDVVSRDYLRSELQALVKELDQLGGVSSLEPRAGKGRKKSREPREPRETS
jgi:uncharacterized membrane protein